MVEHLQTHRSSCASKSTMPPR
uniref:Uncharacterized protein n=1 Tax=Arundo donax TaxID=35708 RepID=A0A0A9AF00_ARUDO